MKRVCTRFKEGAASFYIVAFSTLILVIIVASFIAVVISQLARTANDDLSQSAYDSALAGIEDAKVAYYNYQKCLDAPASNPDCGKIIDWMRNPNCDMVARILGRIPENADGSEVFIEESSNISSNGEANNMQQAYTCVKIETELGDYRSTLTEADPTQVVRVRLGNGVKASQINKIKVSWYSSDDFRSARGSAYHFANFDAGKVVFPQFNSDLANPPTISVGLVQTATSFNLEQFETTSANATNRGTVFLVPTKDRAAAQRPNNQAYLEGNDKLGNYLSAYNGSNNHLSSDWLVKSNNHAVKNLPFAVYCPENRDDGAEFACSAEISLPNPIGGSRSDDTFMFVVSIPYARPSTSFSLEFFCDSECGVETVAGEENATNRASLSGMQIKIDSTGRANNLYRRIEARMDTSDSFYPFPLYALELLDPNPGAGGSLIKPRYSFTP